MSKKTFVLVILDGWGIGRKNNSNPIYVQNPKTINYIKHNYPAASLQASGIAVGLPWEEEGNSEVGHLTLGAGKVIYQHFPRISLSVKNGDFFKNQILLEAFEHAKKNNSAVNLVGLISQGNVHASFQHLQALIKMAESLNVPKLNLHLITDGKDGAPDAGADLIQKLGNLRIASLSGRYFAMDRDFHLDRTEKAYNAMVGLTLNPGFENASLLLNAYYNKGLGDESVEPILLIADGKISDNDSVIFFNFREDSMRQLTEMFIKFPLNNLLLTSFTMYSDKFNIPVAYPPEKIANPLGRVISDSGKVQLRLAETQKYAHVTYFFNGFVETPFRNEYRVLIPSRNITRDDEFPEMMAPEITARAISAIEEGIYDFILINYANADMIGHTGNYQAGLKAVEAVDQQLKQLMEALLASGGTLLITADHGNIERILDPRTGLPETKHDVGPVPLYLVAQGYERAKEDSLVEAIESESVGVLSDVAPTILELMGLPKPDEMTGESLLNSLR
ncbi:MAG: 2,3-bisphosphoglycerate-independent phosphoglycerate mutase [Candidatus Colwellbacteria bacterium]|nr:2,3-bisphosphoglycerate-independent phosphoglycerate mutase [Candidatus Colwellbacteria bacterium]